MSEQEKNEWFVYIIETQKNHLYTGITKDVERRFLEHCDTYRGTPRAKGAKYFRFNKPEKVVYSASFSSRSEVSKEEARIKKLTKQKKMNLIQKIR